jgi:hypothetical protein
MNITELDQFSLADTVKFHDRLNPRLWGRDEHLLPEVQERLMAIADDFREFLGVADLDVEDITVSGSNAAYSYTPQSDIDLHLVVRLPEANADVLRELFAAKKYQYNDEHDIRIGGADVELYVQPSGEPHISQGIYSVKNQDWIQVPRRRQPELDDTCVAHKAEDLQQRIGAALERGDETAMQRLWSKIKTMRQTGLEQQGEFGCDNLAFKTLRRTGDLERLKKALTRAHDERLSLAERRRKKKRTRYAYGGYWAPGFALGSENDSGGGDGGGESIMREASRDREILSQFMQYVIDRLNIDPVPRILLHKNSQWSESNHSFGRYDPESTTLHVSLADRHIMDVMRTAAHELTHCRQHQTGPMPSNAGNTGSAWENQAHAQAGVIMRDFAAAHPELFDAAELQENASGYIPTAGQKNDPRYKMALTVDIKPGELGRQANKMSLKTDAQGRPALLMKTANQMHEDLANDLRWEFALMETEILGEINMSTSSLRQEAARTGAIAGMEFEMIVPNTENDDGDLEPDYDQDERCRSIDDAVQFFHDGDYNSRNEVERLRARMTNDFQEWLIERIDQDWDRDGEEYIEEWVRNNVDDSEWRDNVDDNTDEQEAFEEFVANVHADAGSNYHQSALDEYREENYGSYDESDWLDDQDLDRMSGVENAYDISWPYWTTVGGGEASIEDVAGDFESHIGRTTRASGSYHSGRVQRPGPNALHYVVEPDGSLDGDNPGDTGLEFVSPPLPIDEILSDLNQVKTWAKEYGCYTNDSTGLHINISVPNYSRENLDFVKLALLMGDKYVLDLFGRASNTYAKSALDMVKSNVRNNPESAQQLLDKMKGNLDSLATKAIHSGVTSKYTSINTKDGHIEFRSPGGDWLDQNFDQIENTLLRFTVAMSAALNPEAYREEYLKKLYKLLTEDNKDDSDTIKYFSEYVAGKIPRAALRSFVKQAQLTRQVKRDKTGGKKMWWGVSRPGYFASIEVVASSKEEAIAKALEPGNYPDWASARNTLQAKPLRPYQEPQAKPAEGNWGIWIRANDRFANQPGSYSRSETPPLMRFPSQAAAELWIEQQRAERPNMRSDIEVREIEPAVQDTGSTTSGNWGVWVPSLDRYATVGNSGPRRFEGRAGAEAWIQDYNQRHAGNDLDLQPREIEPARASNSNQTQLSQTDMENRMELPDQTGDANYEIIDRRTGRRVFVMIANTEYDARRKYADWLSAAGYPIETEDYGFREIALPGSTLDLQRQRAAQEPQDVNPLRPTGPGPWEVANRANNQVYYNPPSSNPIEAESQSLTWLRQNGHNEADFEVRTREGANSDTTQGGIIDIEPDVSQYTAPQTLTRPGQGQQTFTGEWKVLLPSGEEVYRFRGVGNSQSDANRVAAFWLRQNGYGVSGEGFEVLPVMG